MSGHAANPKLAELVQHMLTELGEDASRQGLQRTPERVAKSLAELTSGATQTVADVVGQGVFDEDCSEMVVVKDI
jgi:GTP cyclohydrolase I